MRKVVVWVLVFFNFLLVNNVFASGFGLTSIGKVDTSGQQISHWWYSGVQPTFRGTALPGSDLIIKIDEVSNQISADSAGEWVFTPAAALSEGDHTVNISNNGSEISFTLTLGTNNVNWDKVSQASSSTLPAAGTSWPTLSLIIIGLGSVLVSAKIGNVAKKG